MRTLITIDRLSGITHHITDLSMAEAAAQVEAKFPGGTWSIFGSKAYRAIEREYVVGDDMFTITTAEGIKDSVIARATPWEA